MTYTVCASWATIEDAQACPHGFPADMLEPPADLAEALLLGASTLLNRLAGGQYPGLCEDTVRPCGGWQGQMVAYSDGGGARPIGDCTCGTTWWHEGGGCGCIHRAVKLPLFPVRELVSVEIGADTLAPELFALVDRQWLVRRGDLSWPCWQDLSLPLGEAGTWGVTYSYGEAPDQFGVQAAVALAAQFALACTGSDECTLPKRVTNLVHEGETITLLDPFDLLDKGRTGIYAVDFWLRTVNPHGLDRDAQVINVDLLGPHRTLHTSPG